MKQHFYFARKRNIKELEMQITVEYLTRDHERLEIR